jgi:NADH-quinone oxidoreductase subunit J
MTVYAVIFYVLAVVLLISTLLAITRRQVVYAVVYLIISFISTGLLFYLLGAPFLAILEVIIYAGAIMVLFLFIIMMIDLKPLAGTKGLALGQWLPAIILCAISLFITATLIFAVPGNRMSLKTGMATPIEFGRFLFQNYWFPVEIASFLLLIALVGALYLGRGESKLEGHPSTENR